MGLTEAARRVVGEVGVFSRYGLGRGLRGYQLEVAEAVWRSVREGAGLTFTVVFPRQAGKNELSAQLEAFLLFRRQVRGGSMVKTAPTFRPQLMTSLARLEGLLGGPLTRGCWRRRGGHRIELGAASCSFLSARPGAQVIGATASLLLEGDEAQDLDLEKWDRELVPMGATGNATRVLYGTPWTDGTLLAREAERARELERRDGVRRHFEVGWEAVAAAVPAYRRHVEAEIARLGVGHPIVRTQYLLEPLARADRLLSGGQLALLEGTHPALGGPGERPASWGRGRFVAGIDVAGAEESDPEMLAARPSPRRDATVVVLAWSEEAEGGGGRVIEPRLRVCRLEAWRGVAPRSLYPAVLALLRRWGVARAVIDATGVGGGLAAYLGAALGERVARPWLYTAASKSRLGYDLLGAINGERLAVFRDGPTAEGPGGEAWGQAELRRELLRQAGAARYELRAQQVLRWSVPEAEGHDDLLNGLALVVQAGPVGARRVAEGRRADG